VLRIKFYGWAVPLNSDSLHIALLTTIVCYPISYHLCICYIFLALSTTRSVIPTGHLLAPLCPSILHFLCPLSDTIFYSSPSNPTVHSGAKDGEARPIRVSYAGGKEIEGRQGTKKVLEEMGPLSQRVSFFYVSHTNSSHS